ncbi:hypothetical protein D3C79_794450 [compost metagenome]
MSNQEHRFRRTLPDLQKQLLHLFSGKGIQGAERLVHQQHAWVGGQCAGQAHALFLTAGQLPDAALAEIGQVYQGEHFLRLAFTLRARHARQFQTEGNVGQDILPGQQGVILKHHAALGTWPLHGHPIKGDTPSTGRNKAGNQVEQ